jgi:hypothetical protein
VPSRHTGETRGDLTLYKVPSRHTGETRGEVFRKMKKFWFFKNIAEHKKAIMKMARNYAE